MNFKPEAGRLTQRAWYGNLVAILLVMAFGWFFGLLMGMAIGFSS